MHHHNPKDLVLPPRMEKLPKFKGYPVTATTMLKEDGTPDFKAVDSEKIWKFKIEKRCAICGDYLDYWIAFMVTPQEAEKREIFESPMHEDCLQTSFLICPWLFYSKAKYSQTTPFNIDKVNAEIEQKGYANVSTHPERQVTNERPPKLGIYVTNRYKHTYINDHKNRISYRVCKVPPPKRLYWIEGN